MGFKFTDFFHGIVIEDSESHVIGGSQEPLFPRDKLGTSNRQFGDFKGLDTTATFIVPNHDISAVEGS